MKTDRVLYLNLTRHWYQCVENGSKTHEYRALTPYWVKRINRVHSGDFVAFRLGYTNTTILRQIINIRVITGWELPKAEYEYFHCQNEQKFFDIEFSKE